MKPMLSIFQLAIKFDYQLLGIFQSFMSFIFDKLTPPPLNKRFKCKRQSQKCQKRGIFHILHFGRQAIAPLSL